MTYTSSAVSYTVSSTLVNPFAIGPVITTASATPSGYNGDYLVPRSAPNTSTSTNGLVSNGGGSLIRRILPIISPTTITSLYYEKRSLQQEEKDLSLSGLIKMTGGVTLSEQQHLPAIPPEKSSLSTGHGNTG